MKTLGPLCLVFASVLLSGCVATKYQPASADQPPAVTLDLRPTHSPIDIHLDAIVSRGAPGSWKRDALWDEYNLFVANRTKHRWRIESVSLVDSSGRVVPAGADPWELERITSDWWRETGVEAAQGVVWGVGQVANVAATAVAVAGVTVLQYGAFARFDTTVQVLGVVATAAAVPKVLEASAEASAKSKEEIEAEFRRRHKALLASLPPGRETRGSAFFPITREPRQLLLVCRSQTETRAIKIDLPAVRSTVANTSTSADSHNLRIVPASL